MLSARIDEGYLEAMAIPLVRGRGIQASDTADIAACRAGQPGNGMPATGPDRTPSASGSASSTAKASRGQRSSASRPTTNTTGLEKARLRGCISRSGRISDSARTLIVASAGDAAALASPLREIVRDIDPNMPISGVRTMEEFYYGNAIGIVLALTRVVGTMGLLGLSLALVGLYGLVAYAAARRTREIGIRMAVGAQSASVLRMVLRHGLVLAASGIVLGVIGSIAVGGLVRGVFPGAGSIDFTTYLLVVPLLVAVMLLAAWIPARRAARIDPLVALRQE